MKFYFRPSGNKKPSKITRGKSLRLMGRDKLGDITKLPEQIEQIKLSDEELFRKAHWRKMCEKLSRRVRLIFRWIEKIAEQIGKEIHLFFVDMLDRSKDLLTFLRRHAEKRSAAKKKKKINSLPVLLGALTAATLVCSVSASYVLIGLFAYYNRSYETVTVPQFLGKAPELTSYDSKSFNIILEYENNSLVTEGTVISQSPPAGALRRIYGRNEKCNVILRVSRIMRIKVPSSLVGMTARDATLALMNAELNCSVNEINSDEIEAGRVISVYPESGSEVLPNDVVTLTVSLGPKIRTVFVPRLVGLGESEAIDRISAAGLVCGNIVYKASSVDAGSVIAQIPAAGNTVKGGDTVSLTVSVGEYTEPRTVPDLYGMTVTEARLALRAVGLTVGGVYSVNASGQGNTVVTQSPAAGTEITSSLNSVNLGVA